MLSLVVCCSLAVDIGWLPAAGNKQAGCEDCAKNRRVVFQEIKVNLKLGYHEKVYSFVKVR